jgi:hypothetical protein
VRTDLSVKATIFPQRQDEVPPRTIHRLEGDITQEAAFM